MSKKRLSRRLEDLFADVTREEITTKPRLRRPPRITGLLTPAGGTPPPSPEPTQAKSLAYERQAAAGTRAGPAERSDVISLGFQQDPPRLSPCQGFHPGL